MNLNKHAEFFNPEDLHESIHIIGCGAIGSTIAEMLARLGIGSLDLYDFDTVTEHNITNQMYKATQVGMPKCKALKAILREINPDIEINIHDQGWHEQSHLSGYVFLAVDNIDLRREIVLENQYNPYILAMFDTRMRLTDGQHFAATWTQENIKRFLATMDFTHDEAKTETPVSACGTTLSVTPTVRMLCSAVVSNFINVCLKKPIAKMILLDAFQYTIDVCYE